MLSLDKVTLSNLSFQTNLTLTFLVTVPGMQRSALIYTHSRKQRTPMANSEALLQIAIHILYLPLWHHQILKPD